MKPFDYNKYLKNNPLLQESITGPDTDVYEEAQNILDDILSERDWMEIADMTFEDALDTVEAYGHRGPKAQAIAEKLVALVLGDGTPTRQMTGDADADFMGEAKQSSSNLTDVVSDLYRKMLKAGDTFDIDDDAVDVRMEKIAKKRFTSAEFPKFDKLNNDQLQAIIPFLQAVIKAKRFSMFDTWNGTKIVDRENEEEQLNEFDAVSFLQGQAIQQAMQSAPQAMSEAEKIITYVLMTVGIGAVAGGLTAIAKDKIGSLNPIPAIKQWWANRQKRKALEPIVAKLKKDPEVMKYVANRNMKGIQTVIKSKLSPEEQKYIGSLTRDALSESSLNEAVGNDFAKAGLELVTVAKSLIKAAGESLIMNSEVKKASMITDGDGLSKLYYHLQDVLGELIGSEGRAFAKEAKKIIVDKYNIEMTNEYGGEMTWR